MTTPPAAKASIVAALDDVRAICLRGGKPDTARVSAAVEHADGLRSIEVVVVLADTTSSSRMVPVPDHEPVAGLPAGPDVAAFTATIGPFDKPGTLTWTVEAVTREGETLRSRGSIPVGASR